MAHLDPACGAIPDNGGIIVEILVVGAQHVNRDALGGLEDIQVVGIDSPLHTAAQRRMIRLAQDDSLGYLPAKTPRNSRVPRRSEPFLQSRITEYTKPAADRHWIVSVMISFDRSNVWPPSIRATISFLPVERLRGWARTSTLASGVTLN